MIMDGYIDKFSKKHNVKYIGWIHEQEYGVAIFEDSDGAEFSFSFADIFYDITSEVPKHELKSFLKDSEKHKYSEIKIPYIKYTKGYKYL